MMAGRKSFGALVRQEREASSLSDLADYTRRGVFWHN